LGDALFSAYFLDGKDIGDLDVLLALAAAHGFEADEARALLGDPDELAETKSIALELSRQGIDGVPFTILGERFAVPGAQPVEVFAMAIEKALAELGREVAEA
jgi:predicted DsbA family dithiol-disulfide isomerase